MRHREHRPAGRRARRRHPPQHAARRPPEPATSTTSPTPSAAALARARRARERRPGYSQQQSTRPQTLGYGLVDSPARPVRLDRREVLGVDRLRRPSRDVLTRDELLDNVMLYWLPGTGASSARLYWESFEHGGRSRRPGLAVPAGCSIFPKETPAVRRWAGRFTDMRHWNEPAAATSPPSERSCSSTRSPSARRGFVSGAGILPELSVRRGRAAIEFYKAAFGAVEEYRVGGTDDTRRSSRSCRSATRRSGSRTSRRSTATSARSRWAAPRCGCC